MTPGCDSRGRNDVRGRGGPSVARGARRRGVRRRCPGRCTVGRAARRGSRAPACGRWQGSIPVSDALWAQRLTPSPAPGRHVAPAGAGPARRASWSVSVTWARPPRREKFLKRIFRDLPGSIPESDAPWTRRLTGVSRTWLSQNPGPPNLARETITRTPTATSPPARLTSPAPRP